MTIILPNSTFLHIPRTGGTWVRRVLSENRLIESELRSETRQESSEYSVNSWHMVPENVSNAFCFVRHPATWYQSYWAYKQDTSSWSHTNPFDQQCADDYFLEFVKKALASYPVGYVTWLYEFYTENSGFVGRQENLRNDLIAALQWAGEDYALDGIESITPKNVSTAERRGLAKYDGETLEKVLKIESKIINKYGYSRYLPPVLFL